MDIDGTAEDTGQAAQAAAQPAVAVLPNRAGQQPSFIAAAPAAAADTVDLCESDKEQEGPAQQHSGLPSAPAPQQQQQQPPLDGGRGCDSADDDVVDVQEAAEEEERQRQQRRRVELEAEALKILGAYMGPTDYIEIRSCEWLLLHCSCCIACRLTRHSTLRRYPPFYPGRRASQSLTSLSVCT